VRAATGLRLERLEREGRRHSRRGRLRVFLDADDVRDFESSAAAAPDAQIAG